MTIEEIITELEGVQYDLENQFELDSIEEYEAFCLNTASVISRILYTLKKQIDE